MKILVTGHTGLLGSEIMSLSSDCEGLSSKILDLRDGLPAKFLVDKQVVIHAAAKVGGVKINTEKVAEFFDDNVRMNMNVIKACKESGVKLVSILSTCVYPDSDFVSYPLTEDQLHAGPPHSSNFGYAYSKRMLDVQTRAYRQQYNCNFITIIPNNLYGPKDNYSLEDGHVVPSLIRKFFEAKMKKQEFVTVWGSGRPIREFTFARDAAKIILWLSQNYNDELPINIGNTDQISIRDLSLLISKLVGFEGEIVFDTSKPEGQFEKPSSNSRFSELNMNFKYTSLEEGLAETISYFSKMYPNVRGV